MDTPEQVIQNRSLMQLSALERSLFYRQNTGSAWQSNKRPLYCGRGDTILLKSGRQIPIMTRAALLLEPRFIEFGLDGAGDACGCYKGFAVQVEYKRPGKNLRPSQELFAAAWRKAGGIYVCAHSEEEAMTELDKAIDAIFPFG